MSLREDLYHPGSVVAHLQGAALQVSMRLPQFAEQIYSDMYADLDDTMLHGLLAMSVEVPLKRYKGKYILPSSKAAGNKVHNEIQKRYKDEFSTKHDVTFERYVFRAKRAFIYVCGPITGLDETPLGKLGRSHLAVDRFWTILRMALTSKRRYKRSWLRADLVDRQRSALWEIKPCSSISNGVWQAALYRNSFNIYRWLFHSFYLPHSALPFLESGDGMFGPVGWFKTMEPVPVVVRVPALAIPIESSELPGQVFYVITTPIDEKKVLKMIRDTVWERIKKAAASGARSTLDAVEEFLRSALALVPLVFLLGLAAVAIVLVGPEAAVAGLAVGLISGDKPRVRGPEEMGTPNMISSQMRRYFRDARLSSSFDRATGAWSFTFHTKPGSTLGDGPEHAPATMNFGGVQVHGIPHSMIGEFAVLHAECCGRIFKNAVRRLDRKYLV